MNSRLEIPHCGSIRIAALSSPIFRLPANSDVDSRTVTIVALSYGLAGTAYAGYALHLFSRGRTWRAGLAAFAMLGAIALTAVWGILGLAFGVTENLLLLTSCLLSDVLRYGAWYAFLLLLTLPGPDAPLATSPARALAPVGVVLVIVGVVIQVGSVIGLHAITGLARYTWFHSLAMIVFALVLLEQVFRNISNDSLWHVKPLCLGLAGAFLFDLYLYSDAVLFKQLDSDAFAIRGFVHASILPLLVISTSRTRDWVAKIRLSQKAAFHSATLLLVGIYLLFMAAVGYYVRNFGGDWGNALQLALMFAALPVLGFVVFSGSMRAKLRVLVGKHFFSYRYDYREEWLRFTQTLSVQDSPQAMGQQVIRGLADLVESPSGLLWLKDATLPFYNQVARWNMPAASGRESADSALCRFIVESGWVINLEEFRSFPRRYDELELPLWLSEAPNAWLIVPLMVGNTMIGFVVLASARTSMDVNWEVNDLLRTAGRQAASFLAQMQATEALLEVRKFDAFNRMSAFVVHDLKNIVTQLSLMLKNAERHRANPEFQKDMLMTVEHSVERMRQLMLQLREGATPPGTPIGVDLAAIVEQIATSKAAQGRTIEATVVERLMTRGHEERIERVVGHLVQNALDATDADGRVWIRLDRQGGQARIEVGDSGHGMSPDFLRERLFKPFQTTKQAGMGIGAYESFQYVQELGGKMSVESEVNVGTRITMLLPLFDVGAESDLRQRETA